MELSTGRAQVGAMPAVLSCPVPFMHMAANGQNHAVSVQNQVPMDTDDGSQAREPADLPPSAPPDIAHGLPHELLLAAAGDIEDAAAAGEKQALLTRVAYLLIPGMGNCTTAGQGSELGHLYLDTLEAAWMAVDSVVRSHSGQQGAPRRRGDGGMARDKAGRVWPRPRRSLRRHEVQRVGQGLHSRCASGTHADEQMAQVHRGAQNAPSGSARMHVTHQQDVWKRITISLWAWDRSLACIEGRPCTRCAFA